MRPLVVLAVVAMALAGCTASNGPGGQSASTGDEDSAALHYNGASTGSHDRQLTCGSSGQISTNANIGSGTARIRVTDGSGARIHDHDVEGPGQASDKRTISGTAGTWKLEVTREAGGMYGGGFSGQYNVDIQC